MKAILIFDLPEEEWEHYASMKGREAFFILDSLWRWLRNEEKYQGKSELGIEEIRDFLKEEADRYSLDFWNIP